MDKIVGLITCIIIIISICQCFSYKDALAKNKKLKEEEVEAQQNNPLIVIKTHEEHDLLLKNNPDKQVLVTYMADWCTHSKQFMPTLSALAKKNKRKNLIIAVIDGDKNKSLEIQAYPTILLHAGGQQQGIASRDYNMLAATLNLT